MNTYSVQQVARAAGCSREVIETWIAREQFVPSVSTRPGKARVYTAYDLARASITAHVAVLCGSVNVARNLANVWEADFRRMPCSSKPRIGLIICAFGQAPLVSVVADLKRALKDVPYHLCGGAGLIIVDFAAVLDPGFARAEEREVAAYPAMFEPVSGGVRNGSRAGSRAYEGAAARQRSRCAASA